MQLKRRLRELERKTSGGFKPWHRIIQEAGQTEAEARVAYEAKNGPIGDGDCLIVRILTPGLKPAAISE